MIYPTTPVLRKNPRTTLLLHCMVTIMHTRILPQLLHCNPTPTCDLLLIYLLFELSSQLSPSYWYKFHKTSLNVSALLATSKQYHVWSFPAASPTVKITVGKITVTGKIENEGLESSPDERGCCWMTGSV